VRHIDKLKISSGRIEWEFRGGWGGSGGLVGLNEIVLLLTRKLIKRGGASVLEKKGKSAS